ncbi:hypothetical protein [uncultured Pleomorphomonas sp.]|uniref:hypothetical protein n=1 Tax=uncultured Pleomorphomonas sp. TaxID=442121 RepID=UPI00258ECF2A|nr:hypothetical protein [uncultured Pleomorphomonas sp.]
MTREEIKQAVRADILARKEPFTFADVVDDAEDKYGRGVPPPMGRWPLRASGSTERIVDAQLQFLRKQGLIKTERRGRLQFWSAVQELLP